MKNVYLAQSSSQIISSNLGYIKCKIGLNQLLVMWFIFEMIWWNLKNRIETSNDSLDKRHKRSHPVALNTSDWSQMKFIFDTSSSSIVVNSETFCYVSEISKYWHSAFEYQSFSFDKVEAILCINAENSFFK